MEIYLIIGAIALVSGFLSGLLGIGGGIVMAPLLLYIPPLFGLPSLTMQTVAGLTVVQGLVGCLAGFWTHKKFDFVSNELSLYMGGTIFVAAAIGGAGSRFIPNTVLLVIFACLAFVAVIFMLIPIANDSEKPDVATIKINRFRAATTASGVGLLGGMVGQGGSFILIPLMTSYVKIPTRIAMGSNLAIVLFSSIAAFLGKAVTGQIEWLLTIPVAVAVIPSAFLGGLTSRRVSVLYLRRLLAILIGLAAVRISITVII